MDEAPFLTLIWRRSQRSALPHCEGAFPAPPTKREGKFVPVDPAVPRPAPALEAAGADREVPHPRSRRPASSSRIPSAASSDALPLLDSRGGEPCQVAWGLNSGRRRDADAWRGDASDGEVRGGLWGSGTTREQGSGGSGSTGEGG
jgi:hypothetical protein